MFSLLLNLTAHSYDVLPASGANGAIIHYKPETESCAIVDAKKLFLLDSGAQYVDGTTDVTRTVHFGEPTARQKECFTRVLQVAKFFFFFFFHFKNSRNFNYVDGLMFA